MAEAGIMHCLYSDRLRQCTFISSSQKYAQLQFLLCDRHGPNFTCNRCDLSWCYDLCAMLISALIIPNCLGIESVRL